MIQAGGASAVASISFVCRFAGGLALASVFASTAFAAPESPAAAQGASFDVNEIRVLGNTVLQSIQIERVIYPFVGPNKNIQDMNGARTALENAYHAQGFGTVFVDLPEQELVDGIVRLKVTEGRLASIHMTGARYFSDRRLLAEMPEVARGGVPNLPKLQQQISQVNAQSADRAVVPILKAGSKPGTVDMALNVQDHLPLHGSIEFNNQQTQDTRPIRGLVSLSYDNLFGRLDQISVQYQDSPQQPDQVGVLAANLAVHLYDGGPPISLYYVDSKTNVATLGTLGVLGRGSIFGLRFTDTIENRAEASSGVTFGVDYKHFLQSISVDPTTALNTPNSYMLFSAAYAGVWRSDQRTWTLDTSANLGSREIVDQEARFEAARFRGRANFFYLHAAGSVINQLPGGMHLTARLSGQGAVEPLVSNEYFSIAGVDGVRGYLEAEEFGDVALKGTLQLSSPQFRPWKGVFAGDMYTFYDDGRVTFLASLPGQPGHAELRSVGAGFDFLEGQHFTGSLTWAYPLLSGPITEARSSKVLFVVRGSF